MKAANRPAPAPVITPAALRRTVLLVVPDPAEQAELAAILLRDGYEIVEAMTGSDALELCLAREPDMVLADRALPDMSGLSLCAAFRRMERQSHGYFVLLSADGGDAEMQAGLREGVDDILTKPVAPMALRARLAAGERLLRIEEELNASNAQLRSALERLSETQAAIERDLREARKLQQGLVRERAGRFGMAEVSLLLRPAGHIGGDLVGFFPISDHRIGLFALDVAGHGVTAALLTAQLSVHLSGSTDQNVALRGGQSGADAVTPGGLAHFFNTMMLEEMNTDSYFTMIYGDLNHRTGKLRMVQAGHPHPVLQRADGSILRLGKGGMPIGVFERPVFDEFTVTMQPGDRLLITSDGITEASTPNGRLLGDDGVEAIMRTNAFLGGVAFLESMAWSVSEYCRGERLDDMSAVLLEMRTDGG
ncbi:PP2C family protein-serine/threonine phosphatase [Paracoccus sp. (in: a-proteobacteria)]|uniref:PP2C family protein-serine/threonine phosphatase n=1 Tax=Paracoccus sp. TaxID=267 RepID=UPI00272C5BDC|nr:fused response regulator/phosphatase [Paracoccus sp. (in: a-proteobacteria)]